MNIKKLLSLSLLAALTMVSFNASADNINANAARIAANSFLKQQSASAPGTLKSPTYADLKLAHAEASSAVDGANAYYAFNIDGGGFIIIAGEDRAATVLGYSDKGHLDFKNLPDNLKALLNGYKKEIEFLQTYKGNDLVVVTPSINATTSVDPLIQTTWGQGMPYYLQCPIYHGEYCVVGCVATAMAQVMYYWRFPTSCSGLAAFYSSGYGQVPALPATTFDYSLMLTSYCHWDWDNSELIQDTYTDEQAQEVAKLSRYCGQAVDMQYSPDGSGAYTWDQLSAMKNFGYSNSAQDVEKNGWWTGSYTTQEWEAMMREELAAGRPILYSANDPSEGGHAFICDGYNTDGYFHFNLGWYGTCDGWYLSTSLRMIHRDGDQLNFSSGHEMLIGVVPPTYCILDVESIDADNELIVLGDNLATIAQNMTLRTSYRNVKLIFNLSDMNGNNVVSGNEVNVAAGTFVQGTNVNGTITLPTTLAQGSYNLQLNYYTTDASNLIVVGEASGQLQVVGNFAKFNAPFTIEDVTTAIDYLLSGNKPVLTINDITDLIDQLLANA